MKILKTLGLLALTPLLGQDAFADPGGQMQANPMTNARPGVAGGEVSRTGTDEMIVHITNGCYGTNLRSVSNPVSPNSMITATIPLQVTTSGTTTTYNLWIKYPGDIVTAAGMPNPDKVLAADMFGSDPKLEGLTGGLGGNMAELRFKGRSANVLVDPDGTPHETNNTTASVGAMKFEQKMNDCNNTGAVYGSAGWSSYTPTYPCGAYMGQDGPLTYTVDSVNVASDASLVNIKVRFPGQTGFCGGYYSPLMLFFDSKRPAFSGESGFKLSSAGRTWWVEKNAPGYFLALDRNGNGKIDGVDELFGNQDTGENGFDALKALDSNNDGVIDAKDEMFSKLLLWNDKNGDGESDKAELEPLNKRVVKISLKYKSTHRSYGKTAQARQVGDFWFKDGKKTKKAAIEDVWFAPIRAVQK